ncbi:(2Fe-2S) ferredoxin domain-containing protein [Chitinophaga sp. Mgbs1]|uniref:(2Fe-2S) ferredoxin domain-containing protein n=1 Tax=Chitinophaga solisilvae TaxID=1233460 RepID=A0A433WIX0_9BACT|nr:(2Fe-2S) ferredoxin domain-containing protein [Chitinophaga solisilvae]
MGKDLQKVKRIAFICNGNSCLKKGAEETTVQLRAAITALDLHDSTHTIRTRCTGQCEHGPVVFIHPDGIWYKEMLPELTAHLAKSHLLENTPVSDAVFFQDETADH